MGKEHLDTLMPPRAMGSAFTFYEAQCLSSWGGKIFTAQMKQAPTQTTVRAMNEHVSHDDTYEQDRMYPNHGERQWQILTQKS